MICVLFNPPEFLLSEGPPLNKLYDLLDAGEPGIPDANRIMRSFWGMMTQLGSSQVMLVTPQIHNFEMGVGYYTIIE